MKTIIVSEIDLVNRKFVRYHFFDLPSIAENGHRTIASYNAFFNGTRHRNQTKTRLYYGRHFDDIEKDRFNLRDAIPSLSAIPIEKHADLWAFYKAIGYDYKKNKHTPLW